VRAVRFREGAVELADVAPPQGDGVRVRVRACGICGSDLSILAAGFPMAATPGHEVAGELADGTPVAIEPVGPCGRCEFCRRGDYQVCRSGPEMIYGVGRDGGMAEWLLVPARCLVPLPRGLPVADASLVEPLAVALHGLRRAGLRGGERVVVIGAGTIGLCAVAAAAAAGCEVALVARHDAQRAAGARLGAGTPSGEYDVAIDCAASASSFASACEALRPNGTLLMLSTAWGGLELPGLPFGLKELALVASSLYGRSAGGRDVDGAAALLGARPEIAASIITHRFPLEAAAQAFATARDRKAGAIKVVLEPC
jgi:threonine dehydrogenase-like Zn-dependent dehydrogenase